MYKGRTEYMENNTGMKKWQMKMDQPAEERSNQKA